MEVDSFKHLRLAMSVLDDARNGKIPCPNCGSEQVQLVQYLNFSIPYQWKCRHCKHKFETERK